MTLNDFLIRSGISTAQFAKMVGFSIHASRKWRQQVRLPRAKAMAKIKTLTKGKVSPNDWYK